MIICKVCNKEFKQLDSHLRKQHKTSSKEYKEKFPGSKIMNPEDNPMYGKHMTKETKNKISNNKERSKKLSILMKEYRKTHSIAGKNNPMFGRNHTKESIQKMSEIVCNQINNGRNLFANHKKGYFYSKKQNKNIWHDSSYEKKGLEILENDPNVFEFGRSYMKISYKIDDQIKYTIPDFIINNNKIIEVKPQRKLDNIEKERIKVAAIDSYCKNNNLFFEVWTEKELQVGG